MRLKVRRQSLSPRKRGSIKPGILSFSLALGLLQMAGPDPLSLRRMVVMQSLYETNDPPALPKNRTVCLLTLNQYTPVAEKHKRNRA